MYGFNQSDVDMTIALRNLIDKFSGHPLIPTCF